MQYAPNFGAEDGDGLEASPALSAFIATVASRCGMDYFSDSYFPAAGTETDSTQAFWTKGTQ